jgi:hypothetical protein
VKSKTMEDTLIEKTKYQFGTVDSGARIHLLYEIPSWGSGPMCDAYHRDLHPNRSLTVHDVSCLQCRRTLTYHRLLSQTWNERARRSEEFAKFAGTALGQFLRRAGSRQIDLQKQGDPSGSEHSVRPHLLFESEARMRCAFYSLVIKTGALRRKYEGGMRAFVEKYQARCNRDLVALCSMGPEELNDPLHDIEESGLEGEEDFVVFDAFREAIGIEMAREHGTEVGEEVRFSARWLRGFVQKSGVMVHLTDSE